MFALRRMPAVDATAPRRRRSFCRDKKVSFGGLRTECCATKGAKPANQKAGRKTDFLPILNF